MNKIVYEPIGIIHSPNKTPKGTPIQPAAASHIEGKVELFKKYQEGLKDLDGFSHVVLLYHFHQSKQRKSLKKKPYMDNQSHGVFAMRGPSRPNALGMSVVKLKKIKKNKLYIQNVDIVDKTPLLDIKPYVPEFDIHEVEKFGWLEKVVQKLQQTKDDGRFSDL